MSSGRFTTYSAPWVGENGRSEWAGLGTAEIAHTSLVNRRHAMARETVKQRVKRILDLQLDHGIGRHLSGKRSADDHSVPSIRGVTPKAAKGQQSRRSTIQPFSQRAISTARTTKVVPLNSCCATHSGSIGHAIQRMFSSGRPLTTSRYHDCSSRACRCAPRNGIRCDHRDRPHRYH